MDEKVSHLVRVLALLLIVVVTVSTCGSGSTEANVQAAKEQKAQLEAALGLVCDGQGAAEAYNWPQKLDHVLRWRT